MLISDIVRSSMEQGSWIRKMFEEGNNLRERYGDNNVFDLSLGNPIMNPPAEFVEELKRVVNSPLQGMHRYMENAGYADTRKSVAKYLSKESGIAINQNDVIMTCGAAGALNVVLKTILNPGDEVIIFPPFFPEYINYIKNHGGVVNIVSADEQFLPNIIELDKAIGAKTKAVIINSPNNPSGVIYSPDLINAIGKLLENKSLEYGTPITLISDDAYRYIVYDGIKCPYVWPYYKQSVIVNSYSKDLALPGERIGYIAVHPEIAQHDEIIAGLIFCNRILGYVNAPALMQHVISALQGVTVSINDYQRKRDFLYNNLKDLGYQLTMPQGTFYMFPESLIADDIAFVSELAQYRVLTVPGTGFGFPGHIRISYCVNDDTLEGSISGFRKLAEKYKSG
ncbi:MAG: pyridoxal phosphate-dependent aminotransferase [Dehalococcoidales bacterium]|nr:pyridoxal phosphate-dependent aminotransferase [Dehalococcoidales bacterium]